MERHRNDLEEGQAKHLTHFAGKVVRSLTIGKNGLGYDYVVVNFTDGTRFEGLELGQVGEIGWIYSAPDTVLGGS